MRFETSRALDAIERRLSVDPLVAGGVIDLVEAARSVDLDGGRPAALLRLGLFVDALSRQLGDGGVGLYAVAERGAMSDTDFTSNERMVLRRWSDDGLMEMLPPGARPGGRVREVAALTGLPVISRVPLPGHPGPVYVTVGARGGMDLTMAPSTGSTPRPHPVLSRFWRCPAGDCPVFGRPPAAGAGQAPPALPSGAPICPRHGERLIDAGVRPPAVPMVVRINGTVRTRFPLTAARPVVVGRAPEDGITIGNWLDDEASRRVSRNHVRLELRDGMVLVTDVSTNGAAVLARTSAAAAPREVALNRHEAQAMGEWDEVELYPEVTVGRADRPPADVAKGGAPNSVMADAPTIALRLPK
ncbi:FHA domain-containing protein [Dactylosporangium roseum]|uniref:FHA domain-containing protein n=1 Tax=Dactylosporangium roseum TaxID=47989 RepID=A0ABY5YZV3_9ACTN|nr:FHA domain-containing protein [Dactylosporangium roseum]UWZ35291.1 FHA domain-containing protein [Dactylosporangium roseum]